MKKALLVVNVGLCALWMNAQGGTPQPAENYRPKIHFSPQAGWMSDPNGLVYMDGEYHLCYQHIPFAEDGTLHWGEMYWGHAVSRDLCHWQHLPIALSPDSLGYIFSGGSVADLHNTSGLGTAQQPPLLALFTYYDHEAARAGRIETQSQGLAYSTDRGRTWTKYAGNPILPNPGIADFRDPHIFWHDASRQWIMVLTAGRTVRFYSSPNCITWSYLSEFGADVGSHVGPWECPDLFPLQVQGTGQTKWVLLTSVVDFTDRPTRLQTATQYFVGDFDGKHFTSTQRDTLWIDYGRDNYAGITFDNAPHGRRIFVGWMHSHQYAAAAQGYTTRSFSGAATFPRELSLASTQNGYRLVSHPVHELSRLRDKSQKLQRTRIEGTVRLSPEVPFDKAPIELDAHFGKRQNATRYGIRLRNDSGEYISIVYDRLTQCFTADRTHATAVQFSEPFASVEHARLPLGCDPTHWYALIDVASIELFVGGGTVVFTNVFFPSAPFDTIEWIAKGGNATLERGRITSLKNIASQQTDYQQ